MLPPSVCPLTHDARQARRRGHIGKSNRLWSRKRGQPASFIIAAVLGGALVMGVVCAWAPGANATVTYTYTGNHYTYASGVFNYSDRITGSVVFATVLRGNLVNQTVAPVTFSFSDGYDTITQATAVGVTFEDFTTSVSGAITQWAVILNDGYDGMQTLNNPVVSSAIYDASLVFLYNWEGSNLNSPGTWSLPPSEPVPEPSTFAGLGSSLLGFMVLRRRRKTSRRTY